MNQILVLVDFTDTSEKALAQAIALAKMNNSSLKICHIIADGSQVTDAAKEAMKNYIHGVEKEGLQAESVFRSGPLNQEVANYVREYPSSLVVVGTHGKKGIVQHLMGSKIFKLVSGIKASVIVTSDFSNTIKDGYKKILLPIAPHQNFLLKVKESVKVLAKNGKIVLFTIIKPGVDLSDSIMDNTKNAKEYMDTKGISYNVIQVEATNYSVGYSKETMNYAKSQDIDMIGVLTEVSDGNRYYGKMDKENLMLNEEGIAILCVNG